MANGFCPALLRSIDDIAEGNAPGRKLHIAGFLSALFCCQNSTVSPVNDQFEGAHYRPLTVKYTRRPTIADVQDEDNCDVNRIPSYSEWTLPNLNHKQSSFFLADNTIQQYCVEASRTQAAGQPPTQLMQEIYDRIIETANIVMKAINQDLVTEMATQFGENVVTGSDNGRVINIARDPGVILDNGYVALLRDIQENEICGEPCLIGGGLWSSWNYAQALACCNQAGIDLSRAGLPKLFFDKDTQNIWGQNSAALLAPGSVKFIGRNKYQGSFSGARGTSFFSVLPLPVNEFGCNLDQCLADLMFDMQVKYIDCPTTIEVNGQQQTVNRGWQVIISKEYALWVQPTNAYADADELAGTNGTLKYFLTNNTYSGPAYGSPYN